jgi:glycosyltransferase involved in cell wall biosynthesis
LLRGAKKRPPVEFRAMLSVIIGTRDSERALVPTLAALVPGAMSGLVSEVRLADGGSADETAMVADAAGCHFMVLDGPLGRRLKAAAAAARAPWLLFLRPGVVPDPSWVAEVARFTADGRTAETAAVLRAELPPKFGRRQAWSLLFAALGGRPRPQQGLLIAKRFYEQIGGHSDRAVDPEADILRRISRRRIVTLSAAAVCHPDA